MLGEADNLPDSLYLELKGFTNKYGVVREKKRTTKTITDIDLMRSVFSKKPIPGQNRNREKFYEKPLFVNKEAFSDPKKKP
jgi:hypothetical protein